jgi:hypothetical protein
VTGFFPEPIERGSDDHVFRELVVVVVNRVLLRLRDARLTEKELEEIGFMLRRLWLTAQAYKAKKRDKTLGEWIEQLGGLAREAGINI